MHILIKIGFAVIFVFSFFSISAQVKRTFSAVLLNSTDSTPVANAHVINYKMKKVTSTDLIGRFSFSIRNNDTLVISKIGYQPKELDVRDIKEIVYLEKKSYELNQFDVIPYSSYQDFKDAFVKKIITDNKPKINSSIYLTKEDRIKYDGSSGIGIPYKTHRMKDKERLKDFIRKDSSEAFLYNTIKKITKFESSTKIHDFINFCEFSDTYIYRYRLYDIITRIYECYDEYTILPKDEKNSINNFGNDNNR